MGRFLRTDQEDGGEQELLFDMIAGMLCVMLPLISPWAFLQTEVAQTAEQPTITDPLEIVLEGQQAHVNGAAAHEPLDGLGEAISVALDGQDDRKIVLRFNSDERGSAVHRALSEIHKTGKTPWLALSEEQRCLADLERNQLEEAKP